MPLYSARTSTSPTRAAAAARRGSRPAGRDVQNARASLCGHAAILVLFRRALQSRPCDRGVHRQGRCGVGGDCAAGAPIGARASSVRALRSRQPDDDGARDPRGARRGAHRRATLPGAGWIVATLRPRWPRCSTASTAGSRAATGMASAFGARFDMEIDALLILALADPRVAATARPARGCWLRAAAIRVRRRRLGVAVAARAALPSRRRKAICVVQIAALDPDDPAADRAAGQRVAGRGVAGGARLFVPRRHRSGCGDSASISA